MPDKATVTKRREPPRRSLEEEDDEEVSQSGSGTDDELHDSDRQGGESSPRTHGQQREVFSNITDDDDDDKKHESRARSTNSPANRSIKTKYPKGSTRNSLLSASSSPESTPSRSKAQLYLLMLVPVVIGIVYNFPAQESTSNSKDVDWRSKIDPHDALSEHQQFIVRASMKAIMDKSSSQEGVSTLLILSSDEASAAKLARCLLKLVNTATHKAEIPTEIDLRSHRGGKVKLDSDLRTLLSPGDTIRAVLLRHIDDQTSTDAFERAQLLFAYCDGENPVVPHRLIIMTATNTDGSEDELRETFKARWPTEHDFVDALMSRISGHTLFVDKKQESIC